LSSLRTIIGEACTLRYTAADPPPADSICCTATNHLRRMCGMGDAIEGTRVFNVQSNDGDRLRYEAMIKRKLEQMKIKEAKRVAKLLKAIPAKTKMELKVKEKKSQDELNAFNAFSKNQDRLARLQAVLDEEQGIQTKASGKEHLQEANIKSVDDHALEQAQEREAALAPTAVVHGPGGSLVGAPVEKVVDGNFIEERNGDDPYAAVMTDAHAEVALERDEALAVTARLKEKRIQHEKLQQLEQENHKSAVDQEREAAAQVQRVSEKNFRKYLQANREKVIDAERNVHRSPFLRSRKRLRAN